MTLISAILQQLTLELWHKIMDLLLLLQHNSEKILKNVGYFLLRFDLVFLDFVL
jgi:hypothetical protein